MTLMQTKIGEKYLLKGVNDENLSLKLLGLGLKEEDTFTIENKANGNILIKTLETKIVLSDNLAQKLYVEVAK